MTPELQTKILRLAAQICEMHGEDAGDRSCQDWSDTTENIDALTDEEKQQLAADYEQWNSGGQEDSSPHYFSDEMLVSYIVANALLKIIGDR